jgi:hypothetical protein
MHRIERLINFAQIFASIGLGISYFLPFYQSVGFDEVKYADGWILFFWVIPVLFIIYKLSNRWLIIVLCFLSAIGGVLDLFLITFLATFKSTPLIGFNIAKISIVILVMSWLALSAISLSAPKRKQTEN